MIATSQTLEELITQKQSRLCVSADVKTAEELLHLADQVGPQICLLKTHIDIIEDFHPDLISRLQELADKHNFLLFEDRKFIDIGSTAKAQYEGGLYKIAEWAHITNASALAGEKAIQALAEVGVPRERGLLLLAELSSEGNLARGSYTEQCVEIAKKHPEFVIGFICQKKLADGFLHLTPGVSLIHKGDARGQQYRTPQQAIQQDGCDVVIVGRSIYGAKDPAREAALYREAAVR